MAHDSFAELLEKMKKMQAYQPAYFIDQLIIDFKLENSGEQIGVIEITMTEKPYQPEGNLKKLAQSLREKGIWGNCFLEADYIPGKAYAQDERISMNCIICVGSEYWSNETKQKRKRMTNSLQQKEHQKNTEQHNLSDYRNTCKTKEADIRELNERYTDVCAALKTNQNAQMIQTIKNNLLSKKKERDRCKENLEKLKEQLDRLRTALRLITVPSQISDADITALEHNEMPSENRNALATELESILKQQEECAHNNLIEMSAAQRTLTNQMETLSKKIKSLKQDRIDYDSNVLELKAAIEKEFDARGLRSEVRILADLLEITDSRWQNAVEGYLNTQRFYIIVDPKYYDIAAAVYNKHKHHIHTAAIVNTASSPFQTKMEMM